METLFGLLITKSIVGFCFLLANALFWALLTVFVIHRHPFFILMYLLYLPSTNK
uniref:Uncharacterized protein n=1 Tax=Kalanchoe fedtschenkoi TaxID=63787 RepID=A0A7N0U0L8_KALFE